MIVFPTIKTYAKRAERFAFPYSGHRTAGRLTPACVRSAFACLMLLLRSQRGLWQATFVDRVKRHAYFLIRVPEVPRNLSSGSVGSGLVRGRCLQLHRAEFIERVEPNPYFFTGMHEVSRAGVPVQAWTPSVLAQLRHLPRPTPDHA